MRYAAIQLVEGETPHTIVHRVMLAAHRMGDLFTGLEVLGDLRVGSKRFFRFRTNCPLRVILTFQEERGLIYSEAVGYVVVLPNGVKGAFAASLIQIPGQAGKTRLYRGTKLPNWERQFEKCLV